MSGRVTLNGAGLAGVLITGGGQSVLTGADGSYSLAKLVKGAYVPAASKTGYRFSTTASVTVGPSRSGIDFTAEALPLPETEAAIYKYALRAGWKASVYRAKFSLSATQPVKEGTRTVALTVTGKDGYLRLYGTAVSVSGKQTLRLSVHGGVTGKQELRLRLMVNGSYQDSVLLSSFGGVLKADGWTDYSIPLSVLRATFGTVTGIKVYTSTPQKELLLDNIRFE